MSTSTHPAIYALEQAKVFKLRKLENERSDLARYKEHLRAVSETVHDLEEEIEQIDAAIALIERRAQ